MKQLQKKIKTGTLNINQDDPFELFIAATNIRYCYYNETHKILGNTFGMCILQVSLRGCRSSLDCPGWTCYSLFTAFVLRVTQDFEALTPNLLARTVETVEGGGIVVILLRTVNSLKQLYTMTMVSVRPVSPPHTAEGTNTFLFLQDVHARYRTEAHQDVVGRFNER